MSGLVKLVRPAENFEMIPRALVQHPNLTQDAKWIPIVLACKPPNWVIYAPALRREIGWTKERFTRATRSLAAAGMWHYTKSRQNDGRYTHQWECLLEPPQTLNPEAGFPASGNPASGGPDHGGPESGWPADGKPAYKNETRSKTKSEQNNNNAEVVVLAKDLQERGLLDDEEVAKLRAIASATPLGQRLLDEIGGALRARGRVPPGGIRNVTLFARAVATADQASYTYANQERALRLARQDAQARQIGQPVDQSRPAAPMPPEVKQLIDRLKSEVRS